MKNKIILGFRSTMKKLRASLTDIKEILFCMNILPARVYCCTPSSSDCWNISNFTAHRGHPRVATQYCAAYTLDNLAIKLITELEIESDAVTNAIRFGEKYPVTDTCPSKAHLARVNARCLQMV